MSTLDPGLKFLVATAAADDFARIATESVFGVEAEPNQPAQANVLLEFDGDEAALVAAGVRVRGRAGNIFSGSIDVARIASLQNLPNLRRVEVSRALGHQLDRALPESRVPTVHAGPPGYRGRGVIVGVIDGGIDFRHPAFRKSDGTTRILSIWDQSLVPTPGEHSPMPFGFGVEYTDAAINAALAPNAPTPIRHRDRLVSGGYHGTHVAGIAAGNGMPSPGGQFCGVAPEADLVVVANTRGRVAAERGLGDSNDAVNAVQYILSIAQARGQPVVINLSQGDNVGPHDGTSLLEISIDTHLAQLGGMLVKSAGNEGNKGHHATGMLLQGQRQIVGIDVPPGCGQVVVDLWYPGSDQLQFILAPPTGAAVPVFMAPFSTNPPIRHANGNTVFIDADLNDPGNHDNRTFLILQAGTRPDIEAGTWTLSLDGLAIANGRWHAWIQRNAEATFSPPFVDPSCTISVPGTSQAAITVGSYTDTNDDNDPDVTIGALSPFSSQGPTRDGRWAPTLAAPGQTLTSTQPVTSGTFGPMAGTSMSAPMVTGTIALLLEQAPAASAAAIRQCLEQTARHDASTGVVPNNRWGAGKLDAQGASAFLAPPHP